MEGSIGVRGLRVGESEGQGVVGGGGQKVWVVGSVQ